MGHDSYLNGQFDNSLDIVVYMEGFLHSVQTARIKARVNNNLVKTLPVSLLPGIWWSIESWAEV
jgi:hypothetical protein